MIDTSPMSDDRAHVEVKTPAEKERDVAAERAVRKVKIAIAIMAVILVLTFGAFVVAVVMKLSQTDRSSDREGGLELPQTACTLDLDREADMVDTSLDEDRLMVVTVKDGQREAVIFSLKTCVKLATVRFGQG